MKLNEFLGFPIIKSIPMRFLKNNLEISILFNPRKKLLNNKYFNFNNCSETKEWKRTANMHQTLWILHCLGLAFSTTPHWQMKGEWSAEFQVGGLPVDWQSVWTQMVPQLSKNSWQRTQWFQSQQTHTSNLICQKQKTQKMETMNWFRGQLLLLVQFTFMSHNNFRRSVIWITYVIESDIFILEGAF